MGNILGANVVNFKPFLLYYLKTADVPKVMAIYPHENYNRYGEHNNIPEQRKI